MGSNFILQSCSELKHQLFTFLVNLDLPLNLGQSCKDSLLAYKTRVRYKIGQGTTTESSQDRGVWTSTPIKTSKIAFSVFQARCRLHSFSVADYRKIAMVIHGDYSIVDKNITSMKDNWYFKGFKLTEEGNGCMNFSHLPSDLFSYPNKTVLWDHLILLRLKTTSCLATWLCTTKNWQTNCIVSEFCKGNSTIFSILENTAETNKCLFTFLNKFLKPQNNVNWLSPLCYLFLLSLER